MNNFNLLHNTMYMYIYIYIYKYMYIYNNININVNVLHYVCIVSIVK